MIIPFLNDCEVTDATPEGWQTGAVLLNSQRLGEWPGKVADPGGMTTVGRMKSGALAVAGNPLDAVKTRKQTRILRAGMNGNETAGNE